MYAQLVSLVKNFSSMPVATIVALVLMVSGRVCQKTKRNEFNEVIINHFYFPKNGDGRKKESIRHFKWQFIVSEKKVNRKWPERGNKIESHQQAQEQRAEHKSEHKKRILPLWWLFWVHVESSVETKRVFMFFGSQRGACWNYYHVNCCGFFPHGGSPVKRVTKRFLLLFIFVFGCLRSGS